MFGEHFVNNVVKKNRHNSKCVCFPKMNTDDMSLRNQSKTAVADMHFNIGKPYPLQKSPTVPIKNLKYSIDAILGNTSTTSRTTEKLSNHKEENQSNRDRETKGMGFMVVVSFDINIKASTY